jgi:hypothetical protein
VAPIRDSQIQVGYEVVGNNKPSPYYVRCNASPLTITFFEQS